MFNLFKALFNYWKLPVHKEYQINDPTTPDLVAEIEVPELPDHKPMYTVAGHTPGREPKTELEVQAEQVHLSMTFAVNTSIRMCDFPVRWRAVKNLAAFPRAGQALNAYYDRRSLKFFYDKDRVTKKLVYACDSADVVAHELGHAILDGFRPDMWNTQALEVFAFHEAFGDMLALLTALGHEAMIRHILQETDGDLSKSNAASRLGENIGNAIHNLMPNSGYSPDYLRNAVNEFVYVEPEKLPSKGKDAMLLAEPHNFSRVFTGGFYDLFVGLFNSIEGDRVEAAMKAREIAGKLLFRAARSAPMTPRFFDSVGSHFCEHAKAQPTFVQEVVANVFGRRGIVKEKLRAMNENRLVKTGEAIPIKLTDEPVIRAQAANPLYGLVVDVAMESFREFDSGGGKLLKVHAPHRVLAVAAAKRALDHLHEMRLVGDDKEFGVRDGRLTRNYFSCCGMRRAGVESR